MDCMPDKTSHLAALCQALSDETVPVRENVLLSKHTYLRTGGVASLVITPASLPQLVRAVSLLAEYGQSYRVVGNTSNLLFLDDVNYPCLLSTVDLNNITADPKKQEITAECGVMMPELSRFALRQGARGFEGLEGIPGTVGGGVFMNAGAYGSEIRDFMTEIECVSASGEALSLSLEEAALTHRSSRFRSSPEGLIISRVRFRYEIGTPRKSVRQMELFHAKRHKYQEFILPNLGSLYSGSPYRVLATDNLQFRCVAALFYFFNYKLKIFRRESPLNREWLNKHAEKYLGYDSGCQNYSDKTLNCLVNRGQGTAEMLRFIAHMEEIMKGRVPLENEIVWPF